jgi:hypothetical protein
MRIRIDGISDEGLAKLQELLDSPINSDQQIVVDDIVETTHSDQCQRSQVIISLPDEMAIKAGYILEAVSSHALATITKATITN